MSNEIKVGSHVRLRSGPHPTDPPEGNPGSVVELIDSASDQQARVEWRDENNSVVSGTYSLSWLVPVSIETVARMSREQEQERQHFRDFDELYNNVVRCGWQDPLLKEHVQKLETFLSKHPNLYKNKYIVPCIKNARGHCEAAAIPYRF